MVNAFLAVPMDTIPTYYWVYVFLVEVTALHVRIIRAVYCVMVVKSCTKEGATFNVRLKCTVIRAFVRTVSSLATTARTRQPVHRVWTTHFYLSAVRSASKDQFVQWVISSYKTRPSATASALKGITIWLVIVLATVWDATITNSREAITIATVNVPLDILGIVNCTVSNVKDRSVNRVCSLL